MKIKKETLQPLIKYIIKEVKKELKQELKKEILSEITASSVKKKKKKKKNSLMASLNIEKESPKIKLNENQQHTKKPVPTIKVGGLEIPVNPFSAEERNGVSLNSSDIAGGMQAGPASNLPPEVVDNAMKQFTVPGKFKKIMEKTK